MSLTKIVYMTDGRGFRVSPRIVRAWRANTGRVCDDDGADIPRDDPEFARLAEEEQRVHCTYLLKIRELPKGTCYRIGRDRNGLEVVKTPADYHWQMDATRMPTMKVLDALLFQDDQALEEFIGTYDRHLDNARYVIRKKADGSERLKRFFDYSWSVA